MTKEFCFNCMKEIDTAGVCPHCGFDLEKYECDVHHLEPGTILYGKYLVGRVLGEGGFGITYVGLDLNLQMKVAIKEYYPNGYVTRTDVSLGMVTVLNGKRSAFFYKGQNQFMEEARRLAKFWGLPGIVAVKDYFQENGTAYIVMEYAEGKTMKAMLEENNQKLSADQVMKMVRPVMNSLHKVHDEGLIHRDISPDNLMVGPDGSVKLLDFGAARDYIAEQEKSISVILKPGYAPEEQYRSGGHQGPWTDVYALCATIYRAITGNVPVEALDRLAGEELPKPSALDVKISRTQEYALMKGLSIQAGERYQNMKELEQAMYERELAVEEAEKHQDKKLDKKQESVNNTAQIQTAGGKKKGKLAGLIVGGCVLAAAVGGVLIYNHMDHTIKYDNGDRYEGQVRRGVPDGTGICYYANGDRYEGKWQDGMRQGAAVYYYANGNYLEGVYVDDNLHGSVTYYFADGGEYEFEFEHGVMIGEEETEAESETAEADLEVRTIEYDNGDRYEGQMRGDVKEGTGTYYWASGRVYEGEWKDGKQNGTGKMTYPEDESINSGLVDYYEGEWVNGEKSGTGTRVWLNGNRYDGEFLNGVLSGNGTLSWKDLGTYKGEFADGTMNGTGIMEWLSGERYEGEWKDGERHGEGTFYWANGTRYEGEWQDNVKHGSGTYYDAEGNAEERIYENGERVDNQ